MASDQPSVLGVLRAAAHDAVTCDWSRSAPVAALYCLPAILLMLIAGQFTGYPVEGLVAAGGALVVGFGAFQHLTRLRAAPMLLAAAGTSVSAAIGTMVSGIPVVEAGTAGLWGFALGLFTALDTASWWVLLQCAIALVIATTFPADLLHAGERAGLVLAGGATQIAVITALWHLFPRPFANVGPPNQQLPPATLAEAESMQNRGVITSGYKLPHRPPLSPMGDGRSPTTSAPHNFACSRWRLEARDLAKRLDRAPDKRQADRAR